MKKAFIALAISAGLMCTASFAQTATRSPTEANSPKELPGTAQSPTPPNQPSSAANAQSQPPNQAHIAPGSVIPVELTKTVDAKKAKTGDEVVAKVTQDMKTNQGVVLVPKDTKVIGHVTEAQARHKSEKESELGIAFNQAVLNNQQVQLPMSIQAVIGQDQNSLNSNNNGGSNAAPPPGEAAPGSADSAPNSPMAGRSPTGNPGQPVPSGSDNSGQQQAGNKMPPINAKTQGVIGMSNVTLAPTSNTSQGSLLTSEKKNVKLESGTMLLLRVNQ